MSSTVDALRTELGSGPLMYRYTGAANEEGAFIACSYWLVSALAHLGRRHEATQLMADLAPVAGPLGLMPEMWDPRTGSGLGNTPQALSHLALIQAAGALRSPATRTDGSPGPPAAEPPTEGEQHRD